MLCAACRKTYASSQAACPFCHMPARAGDASPSQSYRKIAMTPSARHDQTTANANDNVAANAAAQTGAPAASTLIEFPTPGRAPKPQWRKDLSERVREIQQRKAQEAAREAEAATAAGPSAPQAHAPVMLEAAAPDVPTADVAAPALGLVPPKPAPEVNPLVVAALKRIERARQPATTTRVSGRGRGGAAVARVAREDYEVAAEVVSPAPRVELEHGAIEAVAQLEQIEACAVGETEAVVVAEAAVQPEPVVEAARPVNLVVVPSPRVEPEAADSNEREKARRHIPLVIDEAYLARREAAETAMLETAAPQAAEHASIVRRVAGGIIDLVVIAFAASPFAAIIELTNGNWADPRVAGSLVGIMLVLLFLYVMASTALAGRTWGLSLVALRTVDAATGSAPTTGQCIRRAFGLLLALATGGLGLLYAIFDAHGRALHDYISGTSIVRE